MLILDLLSRLLGIIGATLGIISWIRIRKEEKEMWETLFIIHELVEKSKVLRVIEPEMGSELHKKLEKMVKKGVLERGPMGKGYTLPGRLRDYIL